jgi:hypothetical protein
MPYDWKGSEHFSEQGLVTEAGRVEMFRKRLIFLSPVESTAVNFGGP